MIKVETFQEHQAEEVAALIARDLQEIISQHYPAEYVASLLEEFSLSGVLARARTQEVFVAVEGDQVVGTGSLADLGEAGNPSYYGTAVFVAPESQRQGIGGRIMRALEARAVELGARKLTVRAARNAREFYEKLGYAYVGGRPVQDERGNYIMEKALG